MKQFKKMNFCILYKCGVVKYPMRNNCEKRTCSISYLFFCITYVTLLNSLMFTNVTCSSLYLSHKIHHRSKIVKDNTDVHKRLPLSKEIPGEISYEYPGDYSIENNVPNSLLSHEHKVQNQLIKDMGLQTFPDARKMNVSQTEYTKMLNVYKQSVQQSRLLSKLHQLASKLDRSVTDHLPETFNFLPTGGVEDTLVRPKRDTFSREMKNINRLYLNFTTEQIVRKVYEKYNTTKHHGDQILVDSSTLELGIRLCPNSAQQVFEKHHVSFVLYQMSDNREGIAMDSYHTHPEEILEDSNEEDGETGCNMYWINFDVSSTIQAWLVHHNSNHGIRVECKGCSEAGISMRKEVSKLQINDAYVMKEKYLRRLGKQRTSPSTNADLNERMVYKHQNYNDCKKKSGISSNRKGRKQRCCRQKMPVNVKEMTGFNFILQPTSFDSYFCQGSCPARYNPINEHSLLQSLMHIRTRNKSKLDRVPRPCCTPKKLLPLEILHLDDDDNTKLRVTHWKNVIVAECGCS